MANLHHKQFSPMKQYINLTEIEREFIYIHLMQWKNKLQIAKLLWRSPSTITREIKRNSVYMWKWRWTYKKYYIPDKAQKNYLIKKSKAWKRWRILKDYQTRENVIELLRKWYSPWIVSWYLRTRLWIEISHETIYKFIYDKEYKHLKLWEYLPMRRKYRKTKRWRKVKKTKIPNRIGINKRSEIINERKEFGHWESDTIEWLRGSWYCLHVSVERVSRKVSIRRISRKGAKETIEAMIEIFKQYPKSAIKTTTPDNWTEFSLREEVRDKTWIQFYFTNPYSSREKWTVERINWFIRRFYPKWTNFKNISDDEIQYVENRINNRPMSVLEYYTPNEMFNQFLSNISP